MNDLIKKENKKALKKLWPVLLGFMLLGAAAGFVGGILGSPIISDLLRETALQLVDGTLLWWVPVLSLALGLPCVLWLQKAGKLFKGWDGEEEEGPELAERLLDRVVMFTSILLPAGMLVMSVVLAGFAGSGAGLAVTAEFLAMIALVCVLQQKAVDLIRRLNPEKQGSVYDSHFHKKWLDSCDENERRQVGESAYVAYRAAGNTCLVLWVLGGILKLGLAVSFAVLLIWGVMQVSYCLTGMKLARGKN